ncbi:glycogen debranching enzyme [Rhodomicrobium udaipurense JA643]|uniref:4-alpha-glucanotransferase n=1 Tax=Rhodomicrobium udaipurense TaxID=1202716 RepID=A0A8I1G8V4_9HYPH|nr:glycogen debranching protein GlgX [Rhodomicrobium udaipurense]KAI94771.1 glycogen debranching enzyme [Rhodomicrobium udaipurense JA643]MBJ7542687.1 glycogen debranching protein GlgX [Rhodomicrobium udaipurense]
MTAIRVGDGSPEPLGLTLDGRGANVAVFSAHATAIELCLFDAAGEREVERIRLPARTGDVWHGRIEGIGAGTRYGVRAHGPYDPANGHRFNPAKLLVDPYALALDRPLKLHPSMFGYRPGTDDLTRDDTDSASAMPKAIALNLSHEPRDARAFAATGAPAILYELHVRGYTKRNPHVPEPVRGTFAGLADPAAIEHLVKLGVTAVELLPCAAWIDERHLAPAGLTNYWGYNPIAFMAPDPRLAPGGWAEVRAATDALHAAGIEIIVDVVFNHTGEGDELGPTVSFRGLDNANYYRLRADDSRFYVNDAGCGNILAADRPAVLRLIMDSLRAWATLGGVDGFRFDLATTLARRETGFDPEAPLLAAIAQDPVLRRLRLIAEPWDIGPGGYQVGEFPANWSEWNDKFRDGVRRFWRGDSGLASEMATRFSGSQDVFYKRRPSASVNFVTAHDGFTLADLVSHERKHNAANGEQNRDGTNDNLSWNNGAEGATDDATILAARRRDERALLATLLFARGTPMLVMGAETGQTQHGNNNAYAQDSETAWLDWAGADAALTAFTARAIALRAAHPALWRDRFLSGELQDASGVPDVQWLSPSGALMQAEDWTRGDLHTVIAALYATHADDRAADRVLVALHAGWDALRIALPEPREGFAWRSVLDSSDATGEPRSASADGVAEIAPRSVVILTEERETGERTKRRSADPELLDHLARAAGIAPDWYDITGERHVVPDDTKRALLSDMGFPAETSGEARASLGRLADERVRRKLPFSLVAREGEAATLRIATDDHRAPRWLIVGREDGGEDAVALEVAASETITAPDGRRIDTIRASLPSLAPGRYTLRLETHSDAACRLTVAPRRCYLPERLRDGGKATGLAAQLYSLRRDGDQGIGDFTTLGRIAGDTAHAGYATLGLNPLHALFPGDRERASPYYPSDRRFLDPLYIDVSTVEGARTRAAFAQHVAAFATLSCTPTVDYAGVWHAKRAVLEAAFADFEAAGDKTSFNAFVAAGGTALAGFALFEAIGETRPGEPWPAWPDALRNRDPSALASFAAEHAPRVRFHQWTQWVAETQLNEAARRGAEAGLWLGFYRDLAVGAAPDGAEAWANADQMLKRAAIGAPPDPLAEGGQNWGLRPPNPLAWTRNGYDVFRGVIAANMRHSGALRIDHAMGLARLFVIPEGASGRDGAYIGFPVDDLIGELALESQRARCVVIGEDLGTVPWGFRETMEAADVLSYRVFWFERDGEGFAPPRTYPAKSVACISTHDLPTLKGWWEGVDIREKEALGLIAAEEAAAARDRRSNDKAALIALLAAEGIAFDASPDAPFDPALTDAAHRLVGTASSLIAIEQIDDLAGETTAVNLPGTDRERPNWRRKLSAMPALGKRR